jgi:hypothetical protein
MLPIPSLSAAVRTPPANGAQFTVGPSRSDRHEASSDYSVNGAPPLIVLLAQQPVHCNFQSCRSAKNPAGSRPSTPHVRRSQERVLRATTLRRICVIAGCHCAATRIPGAIREHGSSLGSSNASTAGCFSHPCCREPARCNPVGEPLPVREPSAGRAGTSAGDYHPAPVRVRDLAGNRSASLVDAVLRGALPGDQPQSDQPICGPTAVVPRLSELSERVVYDPCMGLPMSSGKNWFALTSSLQARGRRQRSTG